MYLPRYFLGRDGVTLLALVEAVLLLPAVDSSSDEACPMRVNILRNLHLLDLFFLMMTDIPRDNRIVILCRSKRLSMIL